jgi:N-methylhydantoinase A
VGILLADTIREYSRTVMVPFGASLESAYEELEAAGKEDFKAEGLEGIPFRSADLRYRGQGYELNVPFGADMAAQFHALHQRRYGFMNQARSLEVVNVRLRMVTPAEPFEQTRMEPREGDGGQALTGSRPVYFDGRFQATRVYDRDQLLPGDTFAGPAIVSEYSSATVLPPGDRLYVDGWSNLVIEVH